MSVHGTVNGEKIENLAPKSGLQANLFDQIYSLKPKNDLPNQVAQLVSFGKLLDDK